MVVIITLVFNKKNKKKSIQKENKKYQTMKTKILEYKEC